MAQSLGHERPKPAGSHSLDELTPGSPERAFGLTVLIPAGRTVWLVRLSESTRNLPHYPLFPAIPPGRRYRLSGLRQHQRGSVLLHGSGRVLGRSPVPRPGRSVARHGGPGQSEDQRRGPAGDVSITGPEARTTGPVQRRVARYIPSRRGGGHQRPNGFGRCLPGRTPADQVRQADKIQGRRNGNSSSRNTLRADILRMPIANFITCGMPFRP